MISRNNRLNIFENFQIDQKLLPEKPEGFDKELPEGQVGASGILIRPSNGWASIGVNANDNVPMITNDIDSTDDNSFIFNENRRVVDYLSYAYQHNRTLINWLKLKIGRNFLKNRITKTPIVKYENIKTFFQDVYDSVKLLDLKENSANFYVQAISEAKENGQKALVEILMKKASVVLRELHIVNHRRLKYVSEKDIITFYNKTNKTNFLKLSWVKNYTRPIPKDVIARKKEMDKDYLFDNYVILHFDKTGDASQMTEKEKEKAKDPILFGVIQNSNKLYFIADWIDEYCDLTLDVLLDTLEQNDAKKLNKSTIEETM